MLNPDRTVNVSIQVLPGVEDSYAVVDRAIEAIRATGIHYMVTPMETVVEGTFDECMAAVRAAHEACFAAGAPRVMTFVKIADAVEGTTIDDKLAKYR
jgi:uncharacterized protein (TIGR00106 family)